MTVEWRALRTGDTDHELIWGTVLPASAAMLAWLYLAGEHAIFACAFKAISGVPCPTCGATRAVVALLRGDLAGALRLHPLAPVAVAGALLYVPYALVVGTFGLRRLRVSLDPPNRTAVRRAACVTLAVVWTFLITDGR